MTRITNSRLVQHAENSSNLCGFTLKDSTDTGLTSKKLISPRLRDWPIAARQWQRYIEKKIGFVLPDEQFQWLLNAVERTAAENTLSLSQLWNAVQTDNQLNQQLLDTVLIPESRFFRHQPSIEFVTALAAQYCQQSQQSLIDNCLEQQADRSIDKNNQPFRVWSVGCSTGQEVWSLAMIFAANHISNYRILGSDVSQQALHRARAGKYDQRQQRLIPLAYQRFMQSVVLSEQKDRQTVPQCQASINSQEVPKLARNSAVPNQNLATWQITPQLHEHVDFIWHNIFTKDPATPHLQQVILCQNMLIYFRQFDQRDILTRLAAQCVLGGHIVLAPGEALFWRPTNMRRVTHSKVNVWQKISA